jgi:hypothetical protein
MTGDDDGLELTRRRAVAALGSLGVASASAGAATSAYLSDRGVFGGNRLVAGELDLRVGWESHYSDWSDDEGDGVDVRMWDGDPDTTGGANALPVGATGLPTNDAWLVAVDDPEGFLENTLVRSIPDGFDASAYAGDEAVDPCTGGDDVSPLPSGVGEDAVTVRVGDLKPGDFGEVTFTFGLCDNPGYVWVRGAITAASENGVVEPEAGDPDEREGVVELLDAVRAAIWVDDGDNYQDSDGSEPLLASGTLRDVLATLADGNGLALPGDLDPSEGGGTGSTTCFAASTAHHVGFAWWLPVDHANEIQTDVATFELGFYTEQCRHNPGPGGADGNGGTGESGESGADGVDAENDRTGGEGDG